MALALPVATAGVASASITGSSRVGTAPVATVGATAEGALSGSTQLHVDVALEPRNPAALAAFATAVSTPGTSVYRHYLGRGQFARVFGPTATTVTAVTRQLEAGGLHVGVISSNHLDLPVSGSAATFARALSTGFQRYRLANGRLAYANTVAPLFPTAIAGAIQAVIGLDSLTAATPLLSSTASVTARRTTPLSAPQVVTGGPQPCSAAVAAAPGLHAYTADQIASAYNFSSLYNAGDEGAGITVALFELAPNATSDISAYQSCYGTSATVTYIEEDGGAGTGAGAAEAVLDIEDVIGLAPKATIDVYQADNSHTGVIDNYNAIVDNDTAQVVSTSWGLCESKADFSAMSAEGTIFQQAAAQGQSVYAAAGDDGSEDCATSALGVDDPASQPYVTGVGGTTLSALGPPPTQTVWNDSSNESGAGGGGLSAFHTMPSYQSGAPASLGVINSLSSGTPCRAPSGSYCREVPDVSADADPSTGYLMYYNGGWRGFGGTSAAAPLWAAFTALTDASSSCEGQAIGFANPDVYEYSADFSDITSGNNDYTPHGDTGGLYPAGTGYDMASGLGTPDGSLLPAALCGAGSTLAPPRRVTATAGDASASVAFIPGSDGGSPVMEYTVAATDITTGAGGPTATGSGSPIEVTGLSNGDSYTFTVTATNGVGTSVPSVASVAVVPAGPPAAPGGVAAVGGDASASVSFTPGLNEGSTTTGYTVTATDATTGANSGPTATGAFSPIEVYGLTNGDSYTFTVSATNAVGTSIPSTMSNAVTPLATAPTPPTGVVSTQATVGRGFSAPKGVAIDAVGDVYVANTANSQVVEVTHSGAQTVIGRGFSTPEGVAVDAVGDVYVANTGDHQVVEVAPGGAQTVIGSGFSTPEGVAVDAVGDVYVADPGNDQVVEVAPGGAQTVIGSGFSSPIGVAVDAAGDVYVADSRVVEVARGGARTVIGSGFSEPFGVAVDAVGDVYVADSGKNQVVEVASQPEATAGPGSATILWAAPRSDGGSPVTGYTVTATDATTTANGGQTCTTTATSGAAPATSCTVTGLVNGDSYTFAVTATNGVGTSDPSGPSNKVVPPGMPTVTSVTPGSGPLSGGTTVTVTGTGFSGATKVLFGAVPGTGLTVVNDSTITVVSPPQAMAIHNVHVVTAQGTSPSVPADTFTYLVPQPDVTAISPTSGSVAGGTTVTVTGTGFAGATKVLFGAVPGTGLTVVNNTTITVVSPPQSKAIHNVHVVTAGGTSPSVAADTFAYLVPQPDVTAISPTSGSVAGGTTVTVTGTGFAGATKVLFGAVPGTGLTVVNNTTITVVSPPQAKAIHNVHVVTAGGTSPSVAADTFSYIKP